MVEFMIKKNWFIFALLILYLLFLCKDHLFGFLDNSEYLTDFLYDTKLEYYKKEYEDMQKLLQINNTDYNIVYSKIILRDIYQFYDEITIGKGISDGVKEQDLVVNELGAVGVIKEANQHSSIVSLLTNSSIELSVRINNSYGILCSKDHKIIVKNIKLDQEIKEGDQVYTSGLTNIPGDILVGSVKKIKTDGLELEYILDVSSVIDMNDLSYVAVITS